MNRLLFTPDALRLVLMPGEVYRLPDMPHTMRVVEGSAWVTVNGEDIILTGRQAHCFDNNAVISPLDRNPLILEILEQKGKVSMNWIDYELNKQHGEEIRRIVEHDALIRQITPNRPRPSSRILAYVGRLLMAWGKTLQTRYGTYPESLKNRLPADRFSA